MEPLSEQWSFVCDTSSSHVYCLCQRIRFITADKKLIDWTSLNRLRDRHVRDKTRKRQMRERQTRERQTRERQTRERQTRERQDT